MIKKILMEYNFKLMTYKQEQELMKRLCLETRWQLMNEFKRCGFFLKWEKERVTARGRKLYTPIYSKRG